MTKPDNATPGNEIRFSGYFDWPGLYQMLTKFSNDESYKIFEVLYKDKTSVDGYAEREIEWVIDKKIDRMERYQITIKIKAWDCQEVEVKQNGVTKKMTRGRLRIRTRPRYWRDYQHKFEATPTYEKLWKIYTKLVSWDWNFNVWDALYTKEYELQSKIKEFLGTDTQ